MLRMQPNRALGCPMSEHIWREYIRREGSPTTRISTATNDTTAAGTSRRGGPILARRYPQNMVRIAPKRCRPYNGPMLEREWGKRGRGRGSQRRPTLPGRPDDTAALWPRADVAYRGPDRRGAEARRPGSPRRGIAGEGRGPVLQQLPHRHHGNFHKNRASRRRLDIEGSLPIDRTNI